MHRQTVVTVAQTAAPDSDWSTDRAGESCLVRAGCEPVLSVLPAQMQIFRL
jgi:hypothetical protein